MSHIMENYSSLLSEVNYVQTFRQLRQKYEQQQERAKERTTVVETTVPGLLRSSGSSNSSSRFRSDPRQLDEDVEMWLQDDDDEDSLEEGEAVVPAGTSASELSKNNSKLDDDLDSIGNSLITHQVHDYFCYHYM